MAPDASHLTVPMGLRIKHWLAVSPLAGALQAIRRLWARIEGARHPELSLLRQEDRMIDTLLARIIKTDWHCLDVGGHLGSVSSLLRHLAPQGSLTIVEASPGKSALLASSFPTATVHRVAVSDEDGEVSFFENLAQPGFSSLANRDTRGETREIKVPARRLDDLIGEARVDFIKIDIEGFEFPALRGGQAMLEREKPVILFEAGALGDDTIDASQADDMVRWLQDDMGYDIYAAFDLYFERPPISTEQFAAYRRYPFLAFNYFALPRDGSGPAI